MATIELKVKKYRQEGDMQHTYSPLKNILKLDNSVGYFNTSEWDIDLSHPLSIECQPSYDGTVNLIINDDKNPPRIVNTRFSRIEDNRYKIINRNQLQQTNLYTEGKIDQQTRLFRNIECIPKFNLIGVDHFGQLKGGMYTFYIKYSDEDKNQTSIIAESGQVSIFHGDFHKISSISGTLADERTDKSVMFRLSNLDTSFSAIDLYYTREYSDENGIRRSEAKQIIKSYPIKQKTELITVTGYEDEVDITIDELNVSYNSVSAVKTHAQVQNRLFFGNTQESNLNVADLQNLSYYIQVELKQKDESIGFVNHMYESKSSDNIDKLEYYSPQNIYYNLGYWPDEMYRLGIVYILNDDSITPVFNLRGCDFSKCSSNIDRIDSKLSNLYSDNKIRKQNYLERNTFLTNGLYLDNTYGVFKNPKISVYDNNSVRPIYYKITLSPDIMYELRANHIKGYFIVRQKRIPTILSQGLSVGIDRLSYTPMLNTSVDNNEYVSEGFLNKSRILTLDYKERMLTTSNKQGSALLSLDANVTPVIQSMLDGSLFVLESIAEAESVSRNNRHYSVSFKDHYINKPTQVKTQAIFVNSDVPLKWVNGFGFSTRVGSANDVKTFGFFSKKEYGSDNKVQLPYIRGVYCPIVGVTSSLKDGNLYNIRIKEYSEGYLKEYFQIRGEDTSPFYAISDRYELNTSGQSIDVYRGDCYTNTVSIRLNRNFTDPDVPINDIIVDSKTWKNNYNGFLNTDAEKWSKINRADLNAVPLGTWVTFKCLSSYNLGLRAFDRSYVDEQALLGNPRGYYPVNDISPNSALKIEESWLLNDGYNATVGQRIHASVQNVPYINDLFDNRIMFSNAQVDTAFKNSYRVFQGLSYGDIDRQYGAIVKLIPWDNNLLCIFEHGIGIVPVNEKALIQTTTGQSIHMYGAGVIQNQISLISSDFGSIWPESIVQTPIGVYGIDTYAKKIWRVSKKSGLETISDMKVQRFLNDNIILKEADKYPVVSLKNVKTHYNNDKGDVMFTFYNFHENKEWNICFNERMNKWITRYSWTPLYSENVNNTFYSIDKRKAEILAIIDNNLRSNSGINTSNNLWTGFEENINQIDIFTLDELFTTTITYSGNKLATDFGMNVSKILSSYIENNSEKQIEIPLNCVELIKKDNEYLMILNKTNIESEVGFLPMYFKIYVDILPTTDISKNTTLLSKTSDIISIIVDHRHNREQFNDLLCNGFYVHGRSGIIDELTTTNNIKPTYWYDKQEPFEFEFVVNDSRGLHKIFNNLIIISNNVEPESFDFEIIGDVYDFKKSGEYKNTELFDNIKLNYDYVLNQHTIVKTQDCKNIEKIGRRLGNIQYKEDAWYSTIDPILFKNNSARIRDKFVKIRVKYSGKDQVIITALKTLYTLSYS